MHTDVGAWRVKACHACHKQCIFELKMATFGGTPKPLIPKRSSSHFSLQYQLKITGKGQENQDFKWSTKWDWLIFSHFITTDAAIWKHMETSKVNFCVDQSYRVHVNRMCWKGCCFYSQQKDQPVPRRLVPPKMPASPVQGETQEQQLK